MAVDKDDNIFVSYSSLREDLVNAGANPNVQLYYHLYLTSKMYNQEDWSDPIDLTDDVIHSYDECVWASMSYSMDDRLHFIYQLDPEPGTAVAGDADTYGDNYFNYLTFPTFVSNKPVDISRDVKVSPNPADDYANVQVTLNAAGKVDVKVYDVMGKLVATNNYGVQPVGIHVYKVNTSSLPSGIYLFSVQAGSSQTTKKVIVK